MSRGFEAGGIQVSRCEAMPFLRNKTKIAEQWPITLIGFGAQTQSRKVHMTTNSNGNLGRFFEDFSEGDIYQHPLGRTITETDNVWFTMLTGNTNQMHFNTHYAGKSTFGQPLVNSTFTVALVLGLSVLDVSQNAVANLGWEQIELPQPVFVGDTLYAESIVRKVRASASRSYAGIVSVHTRGLNQHGDVCVAFNRSVMVYRRSAPHHRAHFPTPKTPITSGEHLRVHAHAAP